MPENLGEHRGQWPSWQLALSILLVTVAGFASKFYPGPGAWWFNDHLGGLFYVAFWCLVGVLVFPQASPGRIAFWVFAITCVLELLQLWHPPWLQQIRGTFLGRSLLGTTFQASDFLYYLLGWGIGWAWAWRLSGHRDE